MSEAPFDSLNLGMAVGDDPRAVEENRSRFARALDVPVGRLFEQQQVHGVTIHEVAPDASRSEVLVLEGDALIARTEGFAVASRTADCVPVLIAHPPTGHVAAVHAGWRGAVAGIVPAAIRALSADPIELLVAIGPHIRVDAFEIGEEVAEQLEAAAPGAMVVDRARPKPHGNLLALLRAQLRSSGVPGHQVDDVGGCTHADAAHFFSHRRDHGNTGRHLSAIVARARA